MLKKKIKLKIVNLWKKFSKRSSRNKTTFKRKVDSDIEEEEFNCMNCDFQANSNSQLKIHFNLKHVSREEIDGNKIECRYCGEQYSDRKMFMEHRKREHGGTVA